MLLFNSRRILFARMSLVMLGMKASLSVDLGKYIDRNMSSDDCKPLLSASV